ncbi:hypothetical protein SZN_25350 [Streptomyces zinciresistens K42]|uniref:Uncharacterized protein n=1 Tax=Streptomyces zinciresistens K42 TaxID=700597 RepID=G2GHT1_9ACTN|nr:hypothetical protein [Streptomyces zinciresistens]EGX56935.1 hypothetical protein SZN_25350 [Streptomyces zinciresistens K42]
MPAPDISLLVSSSKAGESNDKDTTEFIARVKDRKPTRISSVIRESRGHDFKIRRREIPAAPEWVGERLSAR